MLGKKNRSGLGQSRIGGWLEFCLGTAGLLALAYCALAQLEAQTEMRKAIVAEQRTYTSDSPRGGAERPIADGILGMISIPQLRLSAPITSGVDTIELVRGVGHIQGTAFPGGLGTMGLAGHRDTFFRPLRHVKAGMLIRVSGAAGTFRYQVDSTEIVNPDQVRVLDIDSQPELVLITCFPFDYIGAAPQRFIVHAHLLSAAPDAVR